MVRTGAIPRRAPATAGRTIDGQAVVTVATTAEIHILNEVGTRVWSLIDGRRTVEEIMTAVRRELDEAYETVPADVAGDVEEFLADLEKRGLIEFEGREA